MIRIITLCLEQRLLDVAVAVALVLAVAVLLTRFVWQPAKRLAVIQWSLVGGLVLALGLACPWQIFSLGLLGSSDKSRTDAQVVVSRVDQDRIAAKSNHKDAAQRVKNSVDGSAPANSLPLAGQPLENGKATVTQAWTSPAIPNGDGAGSALSWMAIVYTIGAFGMTLWLAVGQWTVNRLVRRSVPAPLELCSSWRDLQSAVATSSRTSRGLNARLLISQDVSLPVAVGLLRPAVVLPSWLAESMTPEQLRPILAHELAHIRRQDATLRWVAALFQIVFYYQPCYWWLRRELRLCQEFLADADATACARSATEYAEQLVALLKAAPARRWRPSPAIGILERRSELYRRIQMLVASPRVVESNPGRRWNLMAGTLLVALSLSLGLITLRAADPQSPAKQVANESHPGDLPPVSYPQGFQFQVVNSQGKPVAGAKVSLWGFSLSGGGFVGLTGNDLQPTISESDAKGFAKVVLPTGGYETQRRFLRELIGSGPQRLALKIEHPGHPIWSGEVEVADDDPIVLSDSTSIEVRAHRINEQTSARRLYPAIGGQASDWSEANGLLTMRRVDLVSKQAAGGLRIVQVPETGPAWFSDLIDLKSKTGNPITLQAVLKPGVRVAGRLSEQVSRPIKNGRVITAIVAGEGTAAHWYWESMAEIAPDGTFVLESLPANENLQIVAVCDGWVSSNPTQAELTEYCQRYRLAKLGDGGRKSTTVFPQLCRLEGSLIEPSIPMQRTATCEVTVLDEFGKGIAGAVVAFAPNQVIYGSGSQTLGAGADRLTSIRAEMKSGMPWKAPPTGEREGAFSAKTDERGIAVISNLPAGRDVNAVTPRPTMLFVLHDDYAVTANSPDPEFDITGPPLIAQLSPGQTGRVTVSMHKASTAQVDLPNVTENELAGRIVDQQGQPVDDVQVLVWEQDDDKIRTDMNGTFRHQLTASHGDDRHLLVRFKKPGYAPYLVADWLLGSPNRVVVMDTKTYFEGTVKRPNGTPAADVLVRANQGPKEDNPRAVIGDIWTETRTDSTGRYKLLVQPDFYAIEIRAPGVGTARVPKPGEEGDAVPESNLLPQPPQPKVAIAPNETKHLDIQLTPGVDFRAQLIDSVTGRPVPNARLWHWQYPGVKGRSDGQGIVSISTMPEGEFTFMIEAPAGYVRGWSPEIPERWKQLIKESHPGRASSPTIELDSGLPFDLQAGMSPVSISLEPGVTITGRVLDPHGKPVSGATVAPARSGKGTSITGDTRYSVATKLDGSFSVVLSPSDGRKYNLMVHDGEYQQWRNWANGIGPVLETKPGQKIENVELHLSRAGSIRGQTVDKQGRPLANIHVQTTALDRFENNYYNPAIRSDKNGQFELSLVRPGKHLVHGWMQVRDREKELAKFPTVNVTAGESLDLGNLYIPPQYRDQE